MWNPSLRARPPLAANSCAPETLTHISSVCHPQIPAQPLAQAIQVPQDRAPRGVPAAVTSQRVSRRSNATRLIFFLAHSESAAIDIDISIALPVPDCQWGRLADRKEKYFLVSRASGSADIAPTLLPSFSMFGRTLSLVSR